MNDGRHTPHLPRAIPRTAAPARAATALTVGVVSLFGGLIAGCGYSASRLRDTASNRLSEWAYGGWLSDYEAAERRAKETGGPLLILYKRPGRSDEPLRKALSSITRDDAEPPFVRCALGSGVEPDRRYVEQFGVDRAPAVVVRHTDGTFHATEGRLTPEGAATFVQSASPPGATPKANPFLARRNEYAWFTSLRDAGVLASDTRRPLLIAYGRRLSRDAEQLDSMLRSPGIHRRFADMVPCRVTVWDAWSDPYDSPFGMLHLPAIIIVWPDGKPDILQRPVSADAIAPFFDDAQRRFASRTEAVAGSPPSPGETATPASAP